MPIRLAHDGAPRELPPDARLAIYRTAQEALTNVRRHAARRARRAAAPLRRGRHVAHRRGPRPAAPSNGSAEAGLGYGLTGMRERAELLDGRLAAAPTDDGFRVELYLPQAR